MLGLLQKHSSNLHFAFNWEIPNFFFHASISHKLCSNGIYSIFNLKNNPKTEFVTILTGWECLQAVDWTSLMVSMPYQNTSSVSSSLPSEPMKSVNPRFIELIGF